jgi:hypothetical protein
VKVIDAVLVLCVCMDGREVMMYQTLWIISCEASRDTRRTGDDRSLICR